MNTADRSIALVDAAIRRRFRHVAFTPDPGVLKAWLDAHGLRTVADHEAGRLMALNAQVQELLDAERLIGHTYLMREDLGDVGLQAVWDEQIEPVLREQPTGGGLETPRRLPGTAMTRRRAIGELDRTGIVLSLTPSERRALAGATTRLGVEWQPDGSARIFSRGHVGTIALSKDTIVSVTTKVPIANVLALASLAYRTRPIPAPVGDALLQSADSAVDWLAVLLVHEMDALVTRGLRQDYLVVEDDVRYLRGRLRFGNPSWARPGLVACEFADFLPDIPENRMLRASLEVLATRRLLPALRIRVQQLLRRFEGVSFVRPAAALLSGCQTNRLNQYYRPSLALCRILLEQSGLQLDAGTVAAPAYFFPMEEVFQEAVVSVLRSRRPDVSRQSGRSFQSVAGGPPRSLTFAADVVVGSPPRLVIDTKYAPPEVPHRFGGWSFHNQHVYQVVFYALSLGCPALLVYPKVDRDVDVTFHIEGIAVSILSVDLGQPGLRGLEALAESVGRLARAVRPGDARWPSRGTVELVPGPPSRGGEYDH